MKSEYPFPPRVSIAINSELEEITYPEWTFSSKENTYEVRTLNPDIFPDGMCRMVHFLSFREMFSLKMVEYQDAEKAFEFYSHSNCGLAFLIYFILDSNKEKHDE